MSGSDRGSNRRDQPGGWSESAGLWALIAVTISALGVVYASAHLAHRFDGSRAKPPPADPFETFFGVLGGSVTWTATSTYVAAAIAAVVLTIAVVVLRVAATRRRRASRLDWTASYLGRGREIEGISQAESRRKADTWGLAADTVAGVCLGRALVGGKKLYASYEDVMVLIAGPRTGKTLCYAIPALLDAPGAVLVTSNKRDLVDATRDVRSAIAGSTGKVWVFDPQSIANEPPDDWWWNPLSYVTDEVKAANLADHFATGSRSADAKTDAYFDPAARDQLAGLLLAAALDERPITDVYRWITRPTDETAVQILERHGYPLTADQLAGVIALPDKQRAGIYGTAQQMASCLTNRAVLRWITDDGTTGRRHFDPAAFVRSTGALYSLSKEGRGTAGPLVTALTVAVVEAAEQLATTQPYGRLRSPLVAVLDEAANVCRWRDLPDLYSHYGSRGIVILTILQSWSQGEEVWGRLGMSKLWSAANVAIYAGGVKEEQFLERLTKLIGQYDKITRSRSTRGAAGGMLATSGGQTSQQLSKERILEVDDLAALPRGRAIVLSSGNRATMVETLPWTNGAHHAAVKASIQAHDPEQQATLSQVAAGAQGQTDLAATKAPRK